jgi:NADH-quinone oxidoreductase subunit C
MTPLHDLAVEKVRGVYPDAIEDIVDFRDERTLVVKREQLVDVCRLLRDDRDLLFNFMADITATDYWPEELRFGVIYHLLSLPNNTRIRVKVYVTREDAVLPSVTDVYISANWYERECYDMFGIRFEGHPDLRRILMPADWEGHPLRRDYPLGYEEVQFSHNWREIQERKPKPVR